MLIFLLVWLFDLVFFWGRGRGIWEGGMLCDIDRLGFLFFCSFVGVMRNVSVVGLAGWLCL